MSIQDELREAEGEILARRPEHDIEPTLERMAALVSVLGDPQRSYPVIHITGTNGKTSTARMIESLLRARGLRTGLFTSPHLSSIRERIVVDGEPVSAEAFVTAYEELAPYLALVDGQQGSQLSFFEVLTGMAFAIFADVPVDVAIVEVGLGGTWDATNIADGAVAVVTPVSLDHTAYLGGTVEEIATDKAGIIKPGAVAVLAQQPLPAAEALLRRVVMVGASVVREGLEFGVLNRDLAVGGQRLDLRGLRGDYTDIVLPLFGAYQASNAAVALAAVEAFAAGAPLPGQSAEHEADRADETAGWPAEDDDDSESPAPADARLADLDDGTPAVPAARPAAEDDPDAPAGALGQDLVREGFAQVTSPARLEVVRRSPVVILDSAHNPAGMEAAMEAVTEAFTFAAIIGVLAVSADKDMPGDPGPDGAGDLRAGGDAELLRSVHGAGQAGGAGRVGVRDGAGACGAAARRRPGDGGRAGRRRVRRRRADPDRGAGHRVGRHRRGRPPPARPGPRRGGPRGRASRRTGPSGP